MRPTATCVIRKISLTIFQWCVVVTAFLMCFQVYAQTTALFEVKSARKLSAHETQVFDLLNQSNVLLGQGQHDEAFKIANSAVSLAKSTKYRDVHAGALHGLGLVELKRGNDLVAEKLFRQALFLFEIEGNLPGQANLRLELAAFAEKKGLLGDARRLVDSSDKFSESFGYKKGLLNTAVNRLTRSDGNTTAAKDKAEKILELARSENVPAIEGLALRKIGRSALEVGDYVAAQNNFDKALEKAKASFDLEAQAYSLIALAELTSEQNKHAKSLTLLTQAIALADQGKFSDVSAYARLRSADTHGALGNYQLMKSTAQLALGIFAANDQRMGKGSANETLGTAQWALGNRKAAELNYLEAIGFAGSAQSTVNEASARLKLAALLRSVNTNAARNEALMALEMYEQLGLKSRMGSALLELGRVQGATNNFPSAIQLFEQGRAIFASMSDKVGMAEADFNIALCNRLANRPLASEALLNEAILVFRAAGKSGSEVTAQIELANVLMLRGQNNKADLVLKEALVTAKHHNQALLTVDILLSQSRLQEALGDPLNATKLAQSALTMASNNGQMHKVAAAKQRLSDIR